MRLAVDANRRQLKTNVESLLSSTIGEELKEALQQSLKLFDAVDNEAKLQSIVMGGTAQGKAQKAFELCTAFQADGEQILNLN